MVGNTLNDLSNRISSSVNIHNPILMVAPKKGFVLPGNRYKGPGIPLEEQFKYDPNMDKILEIYHQPKGKTDTVFMQHDVHYSILLINPRASRGNVRTNLIVRWLNILMQFRGKKENGVMLWLEVRFQQ